MSDYRFEREDLPDEYSLENSFMRDGENTFPFDLEDSINVGRLVLKRNDNNQTVNGLFVFYNHETNFYFCLDTHRTEHHSICEHRDITLAIDDIAKQVIKTTSPLMAPNVFTATTRPDYDLWMQFLEPKVKRFGAELHYYPPDPPERLSLPDDLAGVIDGLGMF